MTMTRLLTVTAMALAWIDFAYAGAVVEPGTPLPADWLRSTAIYRDFRHGTADNGVILEGPDYNILGTNSLELFFQRTFDFAEPSNFRFDGWMFDRREEPGLLDGTPFLAGYLTYTNGRFFLSTYSSEMFIQTFSREVPELTRTYVDRLVVNITPNTVDPEDSADIVYFRNRPDLGSLRVYEDQSATIEVYMNFGSLHLSRFGNVVSSPGSGFFYPLLDSLPVGYVPTATGDGSFIAPTVGSSTVPEPSSLALFLLGVGCLSLQARKRRIMPSQADRKRGIKGVRYLFGNTGNSAKMY